MASWLDRVDRLSPLPLGDRGVLAPGRLRRLRALGWMVVLILALGCVLRFESLGLRRLLPNRSSAAGLVVSLAVGGSALMLYALAVRWVERRRPAELSLRPAATECAAGLAAGGAMFGCTMAVLLLLGDARTVWHGSAPAWQAVSLSLASALGEEIIFRGILFRLLWRAFGPGAAFAVSSLLFGAAHLFNPGATLFGALCIAIEAGVSISAMFALTGRLWAPIGLHAGWNFTQGYLFGAAVSGTSAGAALAHTVPAPGVSVLLSGGGFGPEASLPAMLVCGVVGAAAILAAWRMGRFRLDGPIPPAALASVRPG